MYCNYTSKLSVVGSYSAIGFHLFPCHTLENGVCSCGNPACRDVAKHPLTEHGVKDATRDAEQLKKYFTGPYEIANVAIATGEPSGVWVLDVDDAKALAALEAVNGPLPKTWTAETGGGGRHYYFRFDECCRAFKNAVKFAGALDVRTTGGYVLLPPSVHRSGKEYRWIVPPDACEIADAPEWLIRIVPKREETGASTSTSPGMPFERGEVGPFKVERAKTLAERLTLYLENVPPAISGQRGHDATFTAVCRAVELFGSLTDDEILSAFATWNSCCVPSWTDKELRHKLTQARAKVTQKTKTTNGTETPTIPVDDFPTLDATALYGLAGEIVRTLEPHTEADNAAILLTLLTAFGCCVGRKPFIAVEGTKHHPNVFACIVGKSSRSRKGTSLDRVRDLFADVVAFRECQVSGLSSGEGLIAALQDGDVVQNGGTFTCTGGVSDKRLWVTETEFARTLKAMKRDGNILSAIIRDAWDRGEIASLTKGNPLRASGVHVSITAHVTTDELRKTLDACDTANGFGNRFLWTLARRSKLLPLGGSSLDVTPLRKRIAETVAGASPIERMQWSEVAQRLWCEVYPSLVAEKQGVWDAITSRGEAQTLRLAMIFALLDCSPTIQTQHLEASLAVWRYCDDSARLLFSGDGPLEWTLRKLVYQRPGIMRTELRHSVSHSIKQETFDAALSSLLQRGEIICVPVYEERQAERYYPGVGRRLWTPETKTETEAGETARPSSEVPATSPSPSEAKQEPEATLTELLNWRNANAVLFSRRPDGVVWVTHEAESKLTPAIERAIHVHQKTLEAFLPTSPRQYANIDDFLERAAPNEPWTGDAAEFMRALDEAMVPLS